MKDALQAWRTVDDGNLTATETRAATDFGGNSPGMPYEGVVHVPQATGTTPTLDITVQEAQTVGGTYRTIVTIPQITAAGNYPFRFTNARRWIRLVMTVGGTTPNFGAVHASLDEGKVQNDVQLGVTL